MLRAVAGKQFVIEADDHRVITYRMSAETSVQKDLKDIDITKFALGDSLMVDSTEDDNGYFAAVAVKFEAAAKSADIAHCEEK